MKILMPTAAVLSLLLTTACGGRDAEKSKELAAQQAAPADRSAKPTQSPRKDDTAGRNAATPAPAPRAPEWRELTIPSGAALSLELQTALSSETAKVETPVRARLRNAVVINGYTAIPAGAVFTGTVTDVERAGRVKGRSRLAFTFNEVEMNSGHEDLRTQPITYEGEQTKGEDATKVGAGAGIGAIIGGIAGGGKGAAKGAIIGGAAGTGAVLATRGKEVTLASGTDVATSLADSLTVRVPNK